MYLGNTGVIAIQDAGFGERTGVIPLIIAGRSDAFGLISINSRCINRNAITG